MEKSWRNRGPISSFELHNSSINIFQTPTLYTRVSSSHYQSMTIMNPHICKVSDICMYIAKPLPRDHILKWNKATGWLQGVLIFQGCRVMEKSWIFWNFEIFWNFWKSHGILTKNGQGHGTLYLAIGHLITLECSTHQSQVSGMTLS